MAHPEQRQFVQIVKDLYPSKFKGVDVLEFGSLNLNGTVRDFFEDCNYLGVDIIKGDGVDWVSKCHEFYFKKVDTIISCEMLEHDRDWKKSVLHMYHLLKPGGLLIITCATDGRAEHGTYEHHPNDSPATNDYYHNINGDVFCNYIRTIRMEDYTHININEQSFDLYFYLIKS